MSTINIAAYEFLNRMCTPFRETFRQNLAGAKLLRMQHLLPSRAAA